MKFNTVVINLERRSDRRIETEEQLAGVGWSANFFRAIEPKSAQDFPSIGARGCFLSHLEVLKIAKSTRVDHLIILEDDIAFAPDFVERWGSAMEALESKQWSIFYPGYSSLTGLAEGLSFLSPRTAVMCSHFIMINRDAISMLVKGLETILSRPAGHTLGGPMHVDGAYSTIRMQNEVLRTYAYSPMLGRQRPSRTDVHEPKWFDRIHAVRPIMRYLRKKKLSRKG
jgi:hypothetical protein